MSRSQTTPPGHTPGPWKVVERLPGKSTDEGYLYISTEKNIGIDHWHGLARVPRGWGPGAENARLIAATPDLLAALEHFLALPRDVDANGWAEVQVPGTHLEAMHAAIKKARGP